MLVDIYGVRALIYKRRIMYIMYSLVLRWGGFGYFFGACLFVCFIFLSVCFIYVILVDWYSFGGRLNCGMCYVVG